MLAAFVRISNEHEPQLNIDQMHDCDQMYFELIWLRSITETVTMLPTIYEHQMSATQIVVLLATNTNLNGLHPHGAANVSILDVFVAAAAAAVVVVAAVVAVVVALVVVVVVVVAVAAVAVAELVAAAAVAAVVAVVAVVVAIVVVAAVAGQPPLRSTCPRPAVRVVVVGVVAGVVVGMLASPDRRWRSLSLNQLRYHDGNKCAHWLAWLAQC